MSNFCKTFEIIEQQKIMSNNKDQLVKIMSMAADKDGLESVNDKNFKDIDYVCGLMAQVMEECGLTITEANTALEIVPKEN